MENIISKPHHHYRIFASVLVALALVGAAALLSRHASAESSVAATGEHIITLHDDGVDKGFITEKSTLREALAEQHIRVDANDLTEPGLDEKLVASSYQVNVYRARPVVVRDGNVQTKIITAYRTASQIAEKAHIVLHDEDKVALAVSSDPTTDGAAEVLTITRATPFVFTFYGKTEQAYTQAKTVGDMLKEKGITMGKNDGVTPSVSTSVTTGMAVKLWRDGVQTVTQEEDVPFATKEIQDADQPIGYQQVQTQGVNGKRTVTYEVNMQNGIEVSRVEINSITSVQPTDQVNIVGTKVQLPAGSHEDWMAMAGIASDDYGYVNYIVSHEGGWEPCKVQGGSINCSYSGGYGYGVVQATPGSKMAASGGDWRTNPITQLEWASNYAVGRYGSWQAAYNHWLSHHNW